MNCFIAWSSRLGVQNGRRDAWLKVKASPASMVVGMVDVGDRTGALPDLLLKIADNFDNAVDSMTPVT